LVDGRAIAPAGAPTVVKRVIAAANQIRRRPYVWGGGHRSWLSRGYDCSGAVSYALHGAGLLDVTMVSGQLADWGEPGPGKWITVYANAQHVFMVVAGLRFDTRGDLPGISGPRWHRAWVDPPKFVARHPIAF
jgi:cell wall-associated NlpC family hydrolase